MEEEKFDYVIRSDIDFEDLIAEIGYKNKLFARITEEEGFQNLKNIDFSS